MLKFIDEWIGLFFFSPLEYQTDLQQVCNHWLEFCHCMFFSFLACYWPCVCIVLHHLLEVCHCVFFSFLACYPHCVCIVLRSGVWSRCIVDKARSQRRALQLDIQTDGTRQIAAVISGLPHTTSRRWAASQEQLSMQRLPHRGHEVSSAASWTEALLHDSPHQAANTGWTAQSELSVSPQG